MFRIEVYWSTNGEWKWCLCLCENAVLSVLISTCMYPWHLINMLAVFVIQFICTVGMSMCVFFSLTTGNENIGRMLNSRLLCSFISLFSLDKFRNYFFFRIHLAWSLWLKYLKFMSRKEFSWWNHVEKIRIKTPFCVIRSENKETLKLSIFISVCVSSFFVGINCTSPKYLPMHGLIQTKAHFVFSILQLKKGATVFVILEMHKIYWKKI